MGNSKGSIIGAKVLHEKEIEQSLPTYGKLTEQIEAVRPIAKEYRANQKNSKYGQSDFILPQVINNFSILGSRGTGKSSILKTLYQHLQTQNTNGTDYKKQKNILLPTIIPENLVENVNLMGCILGLLNDTVNQICNSKENNHSICPSSPYPLKKTYTDLMREFVQLQQPYEQISIQQFSTNSEYTRIITSMLEAGNQFALKFRQFIDQLLNEYADDALLFIFIDDIDLSTNRCGDLVKTLLSYLSHPAIVTILAGDIAIFGEALTLDFLHNEQIPDSTFMDKSYLVEKSQYGDGVIKETMLERKKQLAYEYLKKVIPPNNRHFIVNWSLASKRNFCIIQEDKEPSQDDKKPDTLASLLHRLDRHIPLLHGYYVDWEQSNQNVNERQDALLYYPFDTTARGLVSSYRAIQLLVEKLDNHHNENGAINLQEFYADIKFLIESVVASNYELSIHQHLIFEQFLELGNTLKNSNVRFDNYYIWLIQALPYMEYLETGKKTQTINDNEFDGKNDRSSEESLNIKLEILAFQIFVFLDWATRLLGKNDTIYGEDYKKTKKKMLFLLCVNGYINDGNLHLNKIEQAQFRSIFKTHHHPLSAILEGYYNLPFPAAVQYYQSFNIYWFLSPERKKEPFSPVYLEYTVKYIEVLESYYGKGSSNLGQYLKERSQILSFVENLLNFKKENMLVSTLCKQYFYDHSILYKYYITSGCFKFGNKEDIAIGFVLNYLKNIYLDKQLEVSIPANAEKYIKNLEFEAFDRERINLCLIEYPNWDFSDALFDEWLNFVIPTANSDKLNPFYNSYLQYTKDFFDEGKLTKLGKYLNDDLKEMGLNEKKQIDIIFKIDTEKLWNVDRQFLGEENFISIIVNYIIEKLKSVEEKIKNIVSNKNCSLDYFAVKINISNIKDDYDAFQNIYDGVSYTLAARCKENLAQILGKNLLIEEISTTQYIACVLILNQLVYSNAWYGKSEARKLREKLESCKCNIFDDIVNRDDYISKTIKQYFFWLHCYCRYQAANMSDSMYSLLERAADAMKSVKDGIKASDKSYKIKYIDMFAERLDMRPDEVQAIPQLFELPKKEKSK